MFIYIRYWFLLLYLSSGSIYSQSHLHRSELPERQNFNTAIVTNGYDTLSWSKFLKSDEWNIEYESYRSEDTLIARDLGIAVIFPHKYFVSLRTKNRIQLSKKQDGHIEKVLTISSVISPFDSLAEKNDFFHNNDGSWAYGTKGGSMGAFEIIGETFHCLYNDHLVRQYTDDGYSGMGGSEIEFYFVINTFNNHTLSFSNHGLLPSELFFILKEIRLFK